MTSNGLFFLSLPLLGKIAFHRIGAVESDDFCLLLGTTAFFVNDSVRTIKQSAADTARRDGSSNPSCKVLPEQVDEMRPNRN